MNEKTITAVSQTETETILYLNDASTLKIPNQQLIDFYIAMIKAVQTV